MKYSFEEVLDYKQEILQMIDTAIDYTIDKDKKEVENILNSMVVTLKDVKPLYDTYVGVVFIIGQFNNNFKKTRKLLLELSSELESSCEEEEEEQRQAWDKEKTEEEREYYNAIK